MPKSLIWGFSLSVLHCFPRMLWIGRQQHKEKMKSHQYVPTCAPSEMFQKGSLVFMMKRKRKSHGDSLDIKARLNEDHLFWASKKFTSKTRGRGGDEVLKPVVEVRLTTDSGVPRRLPSRHCRPKCLPRQLALFSISLPGYCQCAFVFAAAKVQSCLTKIGVPFHRTLLS